MNVMVNAVNDETVDRLVEEIDREGFACIPGYIGAAELQTMRSFVGQAVERSEGEYVGFTGARAVFGSSLDELAEAPDFQHLMKRLYERGTGRTAPPVEFHQVLRCLTGKTASKHSLVFHYDSYVVTALLPVEIPTSGLTGDLIMLPNMRRIRKSYLANLIDKLLLDNKATQALLKLFVRLNLLSLVRIKLLPGNIYFFWGYRSIHTNEACDPHRIRATALFHYANPHAGDRLHVKLRRRQPALTKTAT